MNRFLSKILRRRSTRSRLESFLSDITPDRLWRSFDSITEPKVRVSTALSLRTMRTAGMFSNSLREMLLSVGKGSIAHTEFPFDAVCFEAAAYCYYSLMRKHLKANLDPEYDDEADDEEAEYFQCLGLATDATTELFRELTDFDLPSDLLMKRCLAYSYEEEVKATPPNEQMFLFLSSSMQSKSPLLTAVAGISTSLPLQLCIASYIPIFSSTLLAELESATREFYLASRNG